jgi:light-harvesting complex II chlorophyll a/b binding protein 5
MASMQVNALFKKAAPAPKKAAPAPAKTIKKSPFPFFKKDTAVEKAKPMISKKAAPVPVKKAAVVVKKPAVTVKKAGAGKSAAGAQKGDGLAKWYGPDRKLYLPSGLLTTADIPSYLDGTLAGDYGFDPLGLGKDGAIEKYRVAEVIHARWAMLAVPGIVIPEALQIQSAEDWRTTGKAFLEGTTGRAGPAELWLAIAVLPLIALMGGAEQFRANPDSAPEGFVPFKGKFTSSAFSGLDPINPGGPLDFYNVAATPQDLQILKVKEIKNGRLAMIAMLGVFVQGATLADAPGANWAKHVANPFGYNFVTLQAIDRTPVL